MNEIQPGFTNPQVLPPKRQLSKTVQIIVLLGVVVMLGFLAYSYVSTGTPLPPIQLDNTATTTVQNTATTTNNIATNITEGWKTYRNEEFGFEISFPETFEAGKITGNNGELFVLEDASSKKRTEGWPAFVIKIPKKTTYTNIEDYLVGTIEKKYWPSCVVDKKSYSVAGFPAALFNTCEFAQPRTAQFIAHGYLFEIWHQDEANLKIVDTFKFIR